MYFHLYQSSVNRQWYFSIKAANHHVIAQSEGYHNKADAIGTINLIKRSATAANTYDDSTRSWAA